MDKYVKEFLDSIEGREWIGRPDVTEMINEIKNYITDMKPLSKHTIKHMFRYFPEFLYKGTAYRFLSQSENIESPLIWNESLDNLSWSVSANSYKSVLYSLSSKNHIIHIYKAEVVGLNLKDFIHSLQWYNESLRSVFEIVDKEEEILVLEYNNLSLYEVLKE